MLRMRDDLAALVRRDVVRALEAPCGEHAPWKDRVTADRQFDGPEAVEAMQTLGSMSVLWRCRFSNTSLGETESLYGAVLVGCRFESVSGRKFSIHRSFLADTTFRECSLQTRRFSDNWSAGDVSGLDSPAGSPDPWLPWASAPQWFGTSNLIDFRHDITFGLGLASEGEAALLDWCELLQGAHGTAAPRCVLGGLASMFPLSLRVETTDAAGDLSRHLDVWRRLLAGRDEDFAAPGPSPSLHVHEGVGFSVFLGSPPSLFWVLREGDGSLLLRTTGLPYELACAYSGGERLFYGDVASGVTLG